MELNNYKSVTPLKKKRKKITASAALILCIISLLVGVLCGKASSNKQTEEQISNRIEEINFEHKKEIDRLSKEIEAWETKNNELKKDLAQAKNAATTNEDSSEQSMENEIPSAHADNSDDEPKKTSSGIGRVFIIIILIAVIGVCGFFAVKIFLKKNENEDDDDEYYDEDDEEEYYDDEDDEEYYDDEDDEEYYDDEDDEEYEEDDEYEEDEDEDDEEE